MNLADFILLLNIVTIMINQGGCELIGCDCLDAADVNDDGRISISDAVYLALYLYLGGADPPPPFAEEGSDPSFLDGLPCAE